MSGARHVSASLSDALWFGEIAQLFQRSEIDTRINTVFSFECIAQAFAVGVDDRDVVLLGHQAGRHALTDAAGAQDDDSHS